jgi:hypothetical protein
LGYTILFDKKIKKLSDKLNSLIRDSNLPLTLQTQLKNITSSLTNSKKKINDVDKIPPKLCGALLQSSLFDDVLSNSFAYIEKRESDLNEKGEKIFVYNFIFFSLNIIFFSFFFFYYYNKYYCFLVAVLIPISLLWFKEDRFKNIDLLKSNKFVALQIILSIALIVIFFVKYPAPTATITFKLK